MQADARLRGRAVQREKIHFGFWGAASLLVAAISVSSIYVFPSGNPQPADLLFCVFAGFVLLFSKIRSSFFTKRQRWFYTCMGLLCFWMIVASLGNAIYFSDSAIAFPALFYLYNSMVAVAALSFFSMNIERSRQLLDFAATLSVAVVFIFWVKDMGAGVSRGTAAFNNPNQMAYFSLLMLGIIITVTPRHKLHRPKAIGLILVLTAICLSSVSFTAIAALLLVYVGLLAKLSNSLLSMLLRGGGAAVILVAAIGVGYNTKIGVDITSMIEGRMHHLQRKVDDVGESRGYTRIVEYPQYLLFGAGERGRHRFDSSHNQEIHSSIGTIIFSYGLPGTVLFLSILGLCAYRAAPYQLFLMAAPFAYSLTHQGLRATLFWLFLVVMLIEVDRGWNSRSG